MVFVCMYVMYVCCLRGDALYVAAGPAFHLTPPPTDKDFWFNLEPHEGVLDLFDEFNWPQGL